MLKSIISTPDAESGASSQSALGRRLPIRSQLVEVTLALNGDSSKCLNAGVGDATPVEGDEKLPNMTSLQLLVHPILPFQLCDPPRTSSAQCGQTVTCQYRCDRHMSLRRHTAHPDSTKLLASSSTLSYPLEHVKRKIWRRSENSSQLRLLGISLKKPLVENRCHAGEIVSSVGRHEALWCVLGVGLPYSIGVKHQMKHGETHHLHT